MTEIEILLLEKIEYYKSQYIDADERGLKTHRTHYGNCINKLNKMLKIL